MSQPELSVGGKVLDASAVAAWTHGSIAFSAWLGTARVRGLIYFLPSLAIAEVQVLRPDTGVLLDDLAAHPHVIVGRLDSIDAAAVERALGAATPSTSSLAGLFTPAILLIPEGQIAGCPLAVVEVLAAVVPLEVEAIMLDITTDIAFAQGADAVPVRKSGGN